MQSQQYFFLYVSLVVGAVGSYAYFSGTELYWHSALPNTAMPKVLRDFLQPAGARENGYVDVGKDNLYVSNLRQENVDKDMNEIDGSCININYCDGATVVIKSDVKSYFFESDLHEGAKMKLKFGKTNKLAKFLPRQVSESIPFSTTKLPEILTHFSMKPKSLEAQAMEDTLKVCEAPAMKGEDKYCATSLESLVDFGVSKLGNRMEIFATEVEEEGPQIYTIGSGTQRIGDKSVVCHKLNYAYAVFYCHEIQDTRAYRVPLKQQQQLGGHINHHRNYKENNVAVAVCHSDTSSWKPKHQAFQELKVKPGTVPICHFLHTDTLFLVNK